jgi:hypothetical protein
MNGPAAGAMNTADVAGLVRSELTAAGIRRRPGRLRARGRVRVRPRAHRRPRGE